VACRAVASCREQFSRSVPDLAMCGDTPLPRLAPVAEAVVGVEFGMPLLSQ
jgi:hypothetical protein